jgi:hypothetical protein
MVGLSTDADFPTTSHLIPFFLQYQTSQHNDFKIMLASLNSRVFFAFTGYHVMHYARYTLW